MKNKEPEIDYKRREREQRRRLLLLRLDRSSLVESLGAFRSSFPVQSISSLHPALSPSPFAALNHIDFFQLT